MLDEPTYPTAPTPTTFKDGIEFQDYVCARMAEHNIILQNFASKRYQLDIGENLQGWEIKLDRRCTETGRLSIEIAEKKDSRQPSWTSSGIFRNDNSWLYIQGNYDVLFIFGKMHLRRYYLQAQPETHESYGTVRKFYIGLDLARRMALKVIDASSAG